MKYIKGKTDEIEEYKGYKISIEHDLNIFEKTKESDHPIYTIFGLGRCYQGYIEDVKKYIDNMIIKYSGY